MPSPSLARRLGLGDAVAIGLGSMIGAGVFAVFAPAAAAAGSGLLIGLGLAAVVAFANATSSAQLAAVHPVSGGSYAYGRAELNDWWGFLAGWCFMIGKTASCAAMALTFAAYAWPGMERPVAIAAVVVLCAINLAGVTRTALARKIIVSLVLAVLAVVVAAGVSAGLDNAAVADPGDAALLVSGAPPTFLGDGLLASGWHGILQSAGLIFFAFAGYARIATMGEEVRDPRRTIPRAIVVALTGAVVVYAVLAAIVLWALGPQGAAESAAPLADIVGAAGWAWAEPAVRVGAALASLGALLALFAGLGRTGLAMAREDDLPRFLSAVSKRTGVPHRAELAVCAVVIALVAFVDLRGAIGFSSFGIMLYYLVANLAALRQGRDVRRYPRWLQVLGAALCVVIAASLPWQSIVGGVIVIAVGLAYRAIRLRRAR
ncbi:MULTISPECIES: APC family permease [unclassified Microbacterium]|uniref:APC family permease n=1 Tax=unclassified Microbacterium TaxID=2609290 RepID=UPI00097EACCE|nr:APC family permease [Microbacterium sp. JB110]RCS61854.1 APC family permease [Microbacterium sp. JB110]SJM66262.1 putative amino acid transporter [Frigoribacterium sp. JB110]